MENEQEKKQITPQQCPCKDCEQRHPGCHTIQCPNGWWEWNKYMQERREQRYKEDQERQNWWRYRHETITRMKSRGGSQRQAKRNRGER